MIINISKYPIINAFYGINNNKINVTDIILKNSTNKNFKINNNLFKKDPCFGVVKKLYITLKNKKKYEFEENSILKINKNEIRIIDGKLSNINNIIKNNNNKVKQIIENNNKVKQIIENNNKVKQIIENNYILSTNVRDENNILEFLIYHIMIGFDKILVIDHLSFNKVEEKIKLLPIEYKNKIDVINFKKEGSYKMHFLNNIILPYMKKNCNKYFIHLDGDEYINLNGNYDNIDSLLKDFNYPDVLNLNWLLFGSNNKKINDNKNKSLIPTFTKSENELCNHFKILINIKVIDDNTLFINPHQIFNLYKTIIYTNICKINFKFYDKIDYYDLFKNSFPNISLDKAKAYINHYTIQSEEDYILRKINRNRDDINISRVLDDKIFLKYNDIINTKLIIYSKKIENIINIDDFGFIILRYVIDKETNKMWINCYNSIRKFYKNKIMIIDDHSKKEFITNEKLINCFIIKSEYKRSGELLPYYYYLKYKFCKRLIVLHDSMLIKKKINFNEINNYKNFTRIFSFSNKCYNIDIKYFKIFCDTIKNGDEVYKYHLDNKDKLIGCFGVAYVIDYEFLNYINNKYNIKNLIKVIDSRDKRKTLERFFSCLFEMEYKTDKLPHLIGSIFETLRKQELNEEVFIVKKFYGR